MNFLTTPLLSDIFPLNILKPLESISHNFTLIKNFFVEV